MNTSDQTNQTPVSEINDQAKPVQNHMVGRSAFLVETVAAGISVRTVFMSEDQKVIEMPALFPDLSYALAQIDDLRQVVSQHFAQAAQVGAQVIAAQQAAHASLAQAEVAAAQNEKQVELASA